MKKETRRVRGGRHFDLLGSVVPGAGPPLPRGRYGVQAEAGVRASQIKRVTVAGQRRTIHILMKYRLLHLCAAHPGDRRTFA